MDARSTGGLVIVVIGVVAIVVAAAFALFFRRRYARLTAVDNSATVVVLGIPRADLLWEAHPEGMVAVMHVYLRIVRDLLRVHHGESLGDVEAGSGSGYLVHVAFREAGDALAFSSELQFALLKADWPTAILADDQCPTVTKADGSGPLFRGPRVRCGIHKAAVATVGPLASATCDVARRAALSGAGGQILITDTMYTAVEALLRAEGTAWHWQYQGEYVHESPPHEMRLYALVPDGLQEREFGVLRYRSSARPVFMSDLMSSFGRQSDTAKLTETNNTTDTASMQGCGYEDYLTTHTAMGTITAWVQRSGDNVPLKTFLSVLNESRADVGATEADVEHIRQHVMQLTRRVCTPGGGSAESEEVPAEQTSFTGLEDIRGGTPSGLGVQHLQDIFALMPLDVFHAFGMRVQQLMAVPAEGTVVPVTQEALAVHNQLEA